MSLHYSKFDGKRLIYLRFLIQTRIYQRAYNIAHIVANIITYDFVCYLQVSTH